MKQGNSSEPKRCSMVKALFRGALAFLALCLVPGKITAEKLTSTVAILLWLRMQCLCRWLMMRPVCRRLTRSLPSRCSPSCQRSAFRSRRRNRLRMQPTETLIQQDLQKERVHSVDHQPTYHRTLHRSAIRCKSASIWLEFCDTERCEVSTSENIYWTTILTII